jgi:hypothetical protein
MQLDQAVAAIVAQREAIMAVVEGLPWADAEAAAERRAFLEAFFDEAATTALAKRLEGECVG